MKAIKDLIDKVWYKWGFFWRTKTPDGSNGMGDLLFNSDYLDAYKENTTEWAYEAVEERMKLLQERKRWPDELNDGPYVVKTWIGRIINRTRRKLFRNWSLPYRYQGRMTRDPYIAWATNAIRLGRQDLIAQVKIPWYIKTPSFTAWWNFVKLRDVKYLHRYRFWKSMWPASKKDYVIRLDEIREKAIKLLTVKLMDVPNGSKVMIVQDARTPPGALRIRCNEIIHFHNLDGLFSYCHNEKGETVHLYAMTDVVIINEPKDLQT